MKCVKKDEVIKRVSDQIALDLTTNKGWSYSSKGAWKSQVRDAKPVTIPVPVSATLPETTPESAKTKKASKKKEK